MTLQSGMSFSEHDRIDNDAGDPVVAAMNPYAPTMVEEDLAAFPETEGASVSKARIVATVILAVSGAGGVFTFCLVLLFLVISLVNGRGDLSDALGAAVMFLVMGPIVGTVIAACGAMPIVPLVMLLWHWLGLFDRIIPLKIAVILFGVCCGGLTGWVSAVVLTGFDPWGFYVGFLPAVFGMAVTPFLMRGLIRKVKTAAHAG